MKVWMIRVGKNRDGKYTVSLCDQFGTVIKDEDGVQESCEWSYITDARRQANGLSKHYGIAVTYDNDIK